MLLGAGDARADVREDQVFPAVARDQAIARGEIHAHRPLLGRDGVLQRRDGEGLSSHRWVSLHEQRAVRRIIPASGATPLDIEGTPTLEIGPWFRLAGDAQWRRRAPGARRGPMSRGTSARRVELQAVLGQAAFGVAVTDGAGRLLDVNDAYCVSTGYPRAELLGHDLTD